MPTPTYDLIASNVLSTSASSVTFSSISGSYRDLIFVAYTPSNGQTFHAVELNGDTGANYRSVSMMGDSSSTLYYRDNNRSGRFSVNGLEGLNGNLLSIWHFLDYSVTNKFKSVLTRGNNTSNKISAISNNWNSTNAITQIRIFSIDNSFPSGSTFYLFGLVG